MDSRLTKPIGVKPIARHMGVLLHGEPVFCVSCGHRGGIVTFGMDRKAGSAIFLCGTDNGCGCDCETRFGVPPEMFTKVPDPDDYRSL
jgi:hypothetical protein